MLKGGGGTTCFEVVLTQGTEVLAILNRGGGGGAVEGMSCLEGGGGRKSLGPTFFTFCSPPSP